MSITVHVYDAAGYSTRDGVAEVPALIAAGAHLWIEAADRDPGLAEFLERVLGLHPLTVEDLLQDRPAPKVEDYGSSLYVVAHGLVAAGSGELATVEIDLVWNAQWLLTHRCGPVAVIDAVVADVARNAQSLQRGPVFVAHAVLDRLVDSYLPVVDDWDEQVEAIESAVVNDPSPNVLQQIFRLKRALQQLRRSGLHQREVLYRLSRGEFALVGGDALPFYRDVYDHFLRVTDLGDGYRELLSSSLDAYLSVVSNRMNEVMKVLTLVSTVLLPMTFVAGVYGMNFEHMPELHWKYGYAAAWAVMLAIGGGMVWWFKARKWL
jgi:magnesium transporter